jgi:hypothetical protein
MLRFIAGGASALLLIGAGFFLWVSRAERDNPVPPAPEAAIGDEDERTSASTGPPQASEKTREEKRFGRADKDKDGRITLEELYQPRRKAFAKLDSNKDGRLSFEEWAISTSEKFGGADADRSGSLSAAEFATTKPKVRAKARPKSCAC